MEMEGKSHMGTPDPSLSKTPSTCAGLFPKSTFLRGEDGPKSSGIPAGHQRTLFPQTWDFSPEPGTFPLVPALPEVEAPALAELSAPPPGKGTWIHLDSPPVDSSPFIFQIPGVFWLFHGTEPLWRQEEHGNGFHLNGYHG